jgi:glycosyltransferase involved in cell wall biosynthesis
MPGLSPIGPEASQPFLVVVVPARNEVERVGDCLRSLRQQDVPVKVLLSDNASDDGTAEAARDSFGELDLVVRTTPPLEGAEHFVSAGRWALDNEPKAGFFAFLAGDDTWSTGFVREAFATLARVPGVAAVFPTFVWEGNDEVRRIAPVSFRQRSPAARQRRALRLPDHRELSNLVYAVYRREAFTDLLTALERGGDRFAVDYAAVWRLLGLYQVEACSAAVSQRHVRRDADLIERVGLRRTEASGLGDTAWLYIRLNLRINRLIAAALQHAVPDGVRSPPAWRVQVIRAPQWLWGAVRHVRGLRIGAAPTIG